jgi:hypothetical protein
MIPIVSVVFLLALLQHGVVYGQDVLAVSSLQTCRSVSFGTVQLACDDTTADTSVLVVRTKTTQSPAGGGGSPTTFEFSVASLPPYGGTSAGSSSNVKCTPDPQYNQCGKTQRLSVSVFAEPPVRRFRMREMSLFQLPFTYYFSLVDNCGTPECVQTRLANYPCTGNTGDCCIYQGSSVSSSQQSSIKTTPTKEQILKWFNATKNGARGRQPGEPINCPTRYADIANYTAPNGQVVDPGTSAILYNFICKKGIKKTNVQFYAAFYQLAPMCRVYQLEQGEVVGRVTVRVTQLDTGVVRDVIVNTAQYETAAVTSEGDMLVRILNVQSASDTLIQSLPGALVVCGDAVPVDGNPDQLQVPPLDMFPRTPTDDADVLVNPWLSLDDETVAYTCPTPQLINLVRGTDRPAANQFYFFLNSVEALGMGRKCGNLGISPDYYRVMTEQVQYSQYQDKIGTDLKFSYANIRQLENLNTCVPEFGIGFRGRVNVTTPCNAVAYFHNQNNGSLAERKAKTNTSLPFLHLPSGYSSVRPNIALKNEFMYMYAPIDAQWEVSIALQATLLGVISRPYSGTIDRTSYTGCTLETNNPTSAGKLVGHVCSGVPKDDPNRAAYVLYAQCNANSGVRVQAPSEQTTAQLAHGKCEIVMFNLIPDGFAPTNTVVQCQLYLGAPEAQPLAYGPNTSLTLDTVSLICDVSNLATKYDPRNLLVDPQDAWTLSNASIVALKTYIPPEPPEKSTTWYTWAGISVILGVFALLVIGLVLFIWVRTKIAAPPQVKVTD